MPIDVQQGRIQPGGVVWLTGGQHRSVRSVLPHQHLHRHPLGRTQQSGLVLLDLFPLRFVASVLEPDLDLRFREPQVFRQLGTLRPGQVALLGEATLQLKHLSMAEGRSGALFPCGRHLLARVQRCRLATV